MFRRAASNARTARKTRTSSSSPTNGGFFLKFSGLTSRKDIFGRLY